ncbi:hypothetical protein A3F07_02535 [candidate division WWE3 bacterium RIFCSPHIGHO2_12_FULL_38_15]|nr:MAG: hypothetical protein A3F07_02535 [candidate division WWE3 bacterium RIFCSPHIGHO2_12_FULL_38_15]OGC54218.1 MAG: hypothetical protein A3B64_03740 [candidate division WWE3 bacterium RIFCSPLOWO2_01_FULL_37_24]HLB51422.1 adenylyltransferase/cytidyltransferase family protein [Patescibacteria group bacterium]
MPTGHVNKQKNYDQRSSKLLEIKDLFGLSKKLKAKNKKIVFTIGTFDLLNPGHCRFLAEAKACGDILVVGVSTDQSVKANKGSDYPLVNQEIRAEIVSFLKTVDYVIFADEIAPHAILLLLKPDIFFTSDWDWNAGLRTKTDKDIIKNFGGKIVVMNIDQPGYSTNILVDHIANIRVTQIMNGYFKEKGTELNIDISNIFKPAEYGDQLPYFKNGFNSNELILDSGEVRKVLSRTGKKKLVLVSGSYDLLHVGHARFIEQAGLLGDVLVVAIPSDKSLRQLKGVGRPVISEKSRAYILGHLDPVDYVVVFDDTTVYSTLETIKPDIFFTVDESWNKGYKQSKEYKLVKSYGGEVALTERQAPYLSASMLIDRLAQKKVKEIFRECMDEERYIKIKEEKSRINGKNGK